MNNKIILIYFVILLILGSNAYTQNIKKDFSDNILDEANIIFIKRERIGKQLLESFVNTELSTQYRINCALALGKIGYMPAIPDLVKSIKLSESILITETDVAVIYPCIKALSSYKLASMPFIIDAYKKEKDEETQRLLCFVIWRAKTEKEAIIYTKGLIADENDEGVKKKLRVLIRILENKN